MHTTVVVIGAGQAGLAMSHCLTEQGIDHVVLERGDIANSWRTQRWDSLRLLTPNWMSRLPGYAYHGDDPDGYMTAGQVVDYLAGYRACFDAPVHTGTTVERVAPVSDGFVVDTSTGAWRSRAVVIATGAATHPSIPTVARELPRATTQLTALEYRNPQQLPDGDVLVVGASASGVQIADELRRHGCAVTLAVGDHVRLPRTYRGRDIHWWMDTIGLLDERPDHPGEVGGARRQLSLQLIGTPEKRTLDLNTLTDAGVQLTGRFMAVARGRAQFSGSLANLVANADLKQDRLLDAIDDHARRHGLDVVLDPPRRPALTRLGAVPTEFDAGRFRAVVWATGYRPDHPWLDPSMLDRRGRLVHDGGVMPTRGAYVLGLPLLRRRKSSFIDGVGCDAIELTRHLRRHLDRIASRRLVQA